MPALRQIAVLFVAALVALGCRSDGPRDAERVPDENHDVARTTIDPPQHAPQAPRIDDGVQVLEILVTPQGFEPASVAVDAREPVRMIFTRTAPEACGEAIQIPVVGIATAPLAVGIPAEVEYRPDQAGVFQFVCGVDTLRGRLVINE
jgi:plastocyanin domain-containing protein